GKSKFARLRSFVPRYSYYSGTAAVEQRVSPTDSPGHVHLEQSPDSWAGRLTGRRAARYAGVPGHDGQRQEGRKAQKGSSRKELRPEEDSEFRQQSQVFSCGAAP